MSQFCKLIFVALCVCILRISCSTNSRPNFIYILTDDQDLLFNSTSVQPSLLKHIRDNGISFKNAFVATTKCCPSRAQTLTGRYFQNIRESNEKLNNCMHIASQYNVINNTQSMFHMLSNAGYITGVFGKLTNDAPNWWCKPIEKGNKPYITGYSRINIPCDENYYQLQWFDKYINDSYTLHNITASPSNYLTSVEGNASIQFLENVIKSYPNSPFMIWIGPHAPHGPSTPAEWYADKLMNITAPRTPNFNIHSPHKIDWIATNPSINVNSSNFIDEEMRDRLRSLMSVDDVINDLFSLLNMYPNILNNTYIIYTSDHGYHLGQWRVTHHKMLPYDTDLRVPMFMRGPKIKPGSVSYDVVGNVDILPTILSLAGINYDENTYDGMDWSQIFDTNNNKWKRDTYLSQYISTGTQATAGGCWFPGNDGSLYPGQVIGGGCCNEYHQAYMTDHAQLNNWRLLRIINDTDNLMYVEWYQLNQTNIVWNDTVFNHPYYYELYNLNDDIWQIDNLYRYTTQTQKIELHELLMNYGSCKGINCR